MTVREVAERLRVDDTTVRRWIKGKTLDAIILPHKGKRMAYRIKASTYEALIAPPEKDQTVRTERERTRYP